MVARIAVGSSGVLLAGLGLFVMVGWLVVDPLLVELGGAGSTPFNAAVCFVALGLGLIARLVRVPVVASVLGWFVAVVSAATLSQYLFAWNLGIDQLVVEAWQRAPLGYPGRMTAIAAALLGLGGVALALARWLPGLCWAAGVVLVGNGVLLALGHLPVLAEVAVWTGWRETALGTAVGVAVAGCGLVFIASYPHRNDARASALVVVVVAAIGFNLWQALVSVELARAASDTADAARSLAVQLQRNREQMVRTLERMAHRLERDPSAARSGAWELDAEDYVSHLVGLRALALHDARGFVMPPVTGELGFAATPSVTVLAQAFSTMETVTTPGQVIVPYLTPRGPEAVVASVAYEELLRSLLADLLPGYGITMRVDGVAVYERYPGESPPRGTPVATFAVGGDVVDARWQATVWPEERVIEGHRGPLPLAVLLLSLLSAALVAVALRFSGRLRKQIEVDDAVWREAHDVLLLITPDGRIERVSNACRAVWGYEPSELVGQPFTRVSALDDDMPKDPAERLFARRDVQGMTLDTIAKDGRRIPMNWSSIWSDELERMIAIGRDVTEQVEYENELERRVAERTHELTFANAELEAFSYSVSHDLRTPLRAIAGFTELLQEEVGPSLDDTGRHYLKRVLEGADRMGRLIDDLLRLGRLSRRDLEIETVDLSAIAERVAANLKEAEPGKSVDFRIQAGLTAEADPRLIELVIENLFGNAWKFTAGKDPAVIEFLQEGPIFTVRDNGVGFDMEHAGALFGVFQRLHGIHEFPGTGIGLATVRRIIERHGGEVWAHGETGEGARFHFTLGGTA